MKKNTKEALEHLTRARELVNRSQTGFEGLSKEQAIMKIRKTREKLWESKLAFNP